MRRYSLAAILGVYAGDDDDGNDKGKVAEKKAHPEPKIQPTMTLDEAKALTNSDGVKYGDLDNETLHGMSIGIGKALSKNHLSDADKTLYIKKQVGIGMILQDRNKQPAS